VIIVGLSAMGMLVARFVRPDAEPLFPMGDGSREDFWRRVLPWPRGVQEDDEIAWHVPDSTEERDRRHAAEFARPAVAGRPIPPVRPQRRVTGR
jgi:hypothetical protein